MAKGKKKAPVQGPAANTRSKAGSSQQTPKQTAPKKAKAQPSPSQKPKVKQADQTHAVSKQAGPKQTELQQNGPRQVNVDKQAVAGKVASGAAAGKQKPVPLAIPAQIVVTQPAQILPLTSTRGRKDQSPNPLDYLTVAELAAIDAQFDKMLKGLDVVLFWTGVQKAHVQRWADIWKLATLTTAMGPLFNSADPTSPKAQKREKAFSRYVKGASIQFAEYARQHCRVIVLTNPPPDIYSDRENNTYQHLEEPILKGVFGNSPVRRIDYVHPTVDGAAHVTYQAWPCNRTGTWIVPFGGNDVKGWQKLNWSYKSLITTSQLNINSAGSGQGSRNAISKLLDSVPQAAITAEGDDGEDKPDHLPSLPTSNRNIELEDDPTSLELDPNPAGDNFKPSSSDIQGHESGLITAKPETCPSIVTTDRAIDEQVCGQEDQRINFHEKRAIREDNYAPEAAFVIRPCEQPVPPPLLPVICVDDIAMGAEITVRVDQHGVDGDFLFLFMKSRRGIDKWWRVTWVVEEKMGGGSE